MLELCLYMIEFAFANKEMKLIDELPFHNTKAMIIHLAEMSNWMLNCQIMKIKDLLCINRSFSFLSFLRQRHLNSAPLDSPLSLFFFLTCAFTRLTYPYRFGDPTDFGKDSRFLCVFLFVSEMLFACERLQLLNWQIYDVFHFA